MQLSLISDVHISTPNDPSHKLLISFFNHPLVLDCDEIYLLGDIFDLMVGPFEEYLENFQELFILISKLTHLNKTIYYVAGNHDFNLGVLMEMANIRFGFAEGRFIYTESILEKNANGKRLVICHGDELEIENTSYQKYRSLIRSRFMKLLAGNLFSYNFVKKLGDYSSGKSRKKNNEKYGKNRFNEYIHKKFRGYAQSLFDKNLCDILICGHSHMQDCYQLDNGKIYLNNGYSKHTRLFTYISEDQAKLIKL